MSRKSKEVQDEQLDRLLDMVGAAIDGDRDDFVSEIDEMRTFIKEFGSNAADDKDFRLANVCMIVEQLISIVGLHVVLQSERDNHPNKLNANP